MVKSTVLFLAFAAAACSSSPRFPDENAQGPGSTVCVVPDSSAVVEASPPPGPDAVASDAADSAVDASADAAEEDVFQGPATFAPWGLQSCWYGPPAYLAVPPCPHGTYVECFANEAGGGLGYCDDAPLGCRRWEGVYRCPAGTRTTNTSCALQTDDVAAWPSTYTYACGTGEP